MVAGAVKLLLLLGTRRSETLNMRWADIDEQHRPGQCPECSARAAGRTLSRCLRSPCGSLSIFARSATTAPGFSWASAALRSGATLRVGPTSSARRPASTSRSMTCAGHARRVARAWALPEHRQPHPGPQGHRRHHRGQRDLRPLRPPARDSFRNGAWANYVEALVTGEEQRGELVAFSRTSAGSGRASAKRRQPEGLS